jgi:dinuclear metal center YbgI/SA1388 family protein
MLIPDFLRALEQVVPLSAAGYDRDAIGLQVGLAAGEEITGVLFAYEVTEGVIAEARKRRANLIVAFHPLIFPNIAAVTDATRTGVLIRELVKSDIALYVQHTAFDTHPEFGTSRLMANELGLLDPQPLRGVMNVDLMEDRRTEFGMGAVGRLGKALSRKALLSLVSNTFDPPFLRCNQGGPKSIRTVAVLGGAGMDFYSDALQAGAEAFITADIRYHDFYRADHDGILLIDAGHAETERFVTRGMVLAAELALSRTLERALEIMNLPEGKPAPRLFAAKEQPNSVRYFHL